MKTINEVKLRARLTKDAELKTFSNGGSIAKLIVCTENNYKNRDGEWQKHAEFHTVVVRGSKTNEAALFRKGEMIDVTGRLQVRSYEVNGEKRYTPEVVCWEVKTAEEQSQAETDGNRINSSDDFNY